MSLEDLQFLKFELNFFKKQTTEAQDFVRPYILDIIEHCIV